MPARPASTHPPRASTIVPGDPLERVLTAVREGSDVRLVGAVGGFRGYALAMAASRAEAPVFAVAPDEASARALAGDAAFFLGARCATRATARCWWCPRSTRRRTPTPRPTRGPWRCGWRRCSAWSTARASRRS
ncbi:hypothetical protein [Nannocystis pusilla]|uniref:hypothetical protein n=1 Tax=Nannocystis pusilla TaxID=889268 RepID=UPI003B7E86BD